MRACAIQHQKKKEMTKSEPTLRRRRRFPANLQPREGILAEPVPPVAQKKTRCFLDGSDSESESTSFENIAPLFRAHYSLLRAWDVGGLLDCRRLSIDHDI